MCQTLVEHHQNYQQIKHCRNTQQLSTSCSTFPWGLIPSDAIWNLLERVRMSHEFECHHPPSIWLPNVTRELNVSEIKIHFASNVPESSRKVGKVCRFGESCCRAALNWRISDYCSCTKVIALHSGALQPPSCQTWPPRRLVNLVACINNA